MPKRIGHARHAGGDDQQVRAQFVGEQAAGEVLVDDGFHADDGAVGFEHDRDSAATGRDDHRTVVEQQADELASRECAADAATARYAASRVLRPP